MHTFLDFLTRIDKRLQNFIICFITADIAMVIVSSMVIWLLFQHMGAQQFSSITVITLLLISIATKKYSYLLDQYSRSRSMFISNLIIVSLLIVTLLFDTVWLYAIVFVVINGYFAIFYPARNALGQALINEAEYKTEKTLTYKQLISVLVITDKLGSIFAATLVATLFSYIGSQWLIVIGISLLIISVCLFSRFDEPNNKLNDGKQTDSTNIKTNINDKEKGYAWFFSHPMSWLLTLGIFVHVVVMLSNTIKPVYFYDVLNLSPEMVEYTSIAFNIGALTAGILIHYIQSEKAVIYGCFGLGVATACAMAFMPTFIMFVICMGILGFATSSNRVMFSSLIMQNVNNKEIATFFGMQSSLINALQFLGLFGINILLMMSTPDNVVWFYPAIYIFIPILWLVSRFLNNANSSKQYQTLS